MIRIGVIGFGKTGKYVCEEILKDKNLKLSWVLKKTPIDQTFASEKLGYSTKNGRFVIPENFTEKFLLDNITDIVIDFSSENSAAIYYDKLKQFNIKIVSAISHYTENQLSIIQNLSKKTAILHLPNITLGINWLIVASKILKQIVPYADIEIIEQHFKQKQGVSGTAMKIAEHLNLNKDEHINSIRIGGVVGKHEIIFGLPSQTIRLVHESIDRAAFARGAIMAAYWLSNQNNGFYTMENVLEDKFKKISTAGI